MFQLNLRCRAAFELIVPVRSFSVGGQGWRQPAALSMTSFRHGVKPSETKIDTFSMRIGDIEGVELDRLHAHSLPWDGLWAPRTGNSCAIGRGFVALTRSAGFFVGHAHGADFATAGMVAPAAARRWGGMP